MLFVNNIPKHVQQPKTKITILPVQVQLWYLAWYKVLVPDLSYLVRYSTVPQCTFWYCTSTSTGTVPVTVLNNKIPYLYLVPYILLYRTALIVQVKHRRGSTQVSVPRGEELMLVARDVDQYQASIWITYSMYLVMVPYSTTVQRTCTSTWY